MRFNKSVVPTPSLRYSQAKRKKNTAVWSLRHAQTAAPATLLDCADVEFPNGTLSIQIGHNQWQKPNFHAFFVNIFMNCKPFVDMGLQIRIDKNPNFTLCQAARPRGCAITPPRRFFRAIPLASPPFFLGFNSPESEKFQP